MRDRRLLPVVLLAILALVAGCASEQAPADPVAGEWNGSIEVPGQPLPIGVTFADGGGTIDIPVQGIADAPLADVVTDPGNVGFTLQGIPGDPAFTGRYADDRITGDFTQAGQSFPLTLARGALPPPARPQEPKPPFPYRSEEVTFRSGDITVAGTLTLPDGAGPFPAVQLVTGSGPQNRDEELMGHKVFLLVADTLTRAGYAVLRTDDRGVGGTGGDLNAATYDVLAGDIAAGTDFLRGRAEIDRERIGLFGHSEGGYLAPLAASKQGDQIDFLVLMAGPAVPGRDVLIEQNGLLLTAAGATPEEARAQQEYVAEWSALLVAGDTAGARAATERHEAALPPEQRSSPAALDAQQAPVMRSFLAYDPAPALRAVRVPTLALFGAKDLQVPPAQSEQPMRDLLAGAPDPTVRTFPGLNHLLQPANTGSPSEYATIETTVDPAALTFVTDWLTTRIPPR
ncbi:alpha/beta hydrolase family protein [Nocardia sp. NPDC057353]|uniref:alpha/beta hydrolase family protein n=1 Tax=Nocardia sp. NPDC057353 TaxID=3346104 RepID=UPI003627AA2D